MFPGIYPVLRPKNPVSSSLHRQNRTPMRQEPSQSGSRLRFQNTVEAYLSTGEDLKGIWVHLQRIHVQHSRSIFQNVSYKVHR